MLAGRDPVTVAVNYSDVWGSRNLDLYDSEPAAPSIFENSATGQRTPVPRHREIPEPLVRVICRQLAIPAPQ